MTAATKHGQQIFPVLRGLRLLEQLDTHVFGHGIRNLSFMLQSAARHGEHTGAADVAVRREALQVAALPWRLYPPEDDPLGLAGR